MEDTTITEVSYCTIGEYDNIKDCELNGGEWKVINVTTDFDDNFSLTDVEKEIRLRMDEANECFADPILQEYLNDISGEVDIN